MNQKKVLFIAYYYFPFKEVGATRVNYWSKELPLNSNFKSFVLTSTKINHMADISVDGLEIKRIPTLTMSPFVWSLKIIPAIFNLSRKCRIAVISGGPFSPFFLSYLLRFLGCKVILDFRDPYANNPLHKVNIIKRYLKLFFEALVCLPANKIITVNPYCQELIAANKKKFTIIDNGFDEKTVNSLTPHKTSLNTIGYAGKINPSRNINAFLATMVKSHVYMNFKLIYIGPDFDKISSKFKDKVKNIGFVSYKKTLEELNKCEILLLLYGGEKFESSTKVFDYISLKKPILLYPNKKSTKTQIDKILENYPHTKSLLEKPTDRGLANFNTVLFSRKKGLQKLIKTINEVC